MKTHAIIIVPGGEEPRTYPRVFLSDGDHSKAFEITNWLASVNVNSSTDVHSNQVSCHFVGEVIHLAALPPEKLDTQDIDTWQPETGGKFKVDAPLYVESQRFTKTPEWLAGFMDNWNSEFIHRGHYNEYQCRLYEYGIKFSEKCRSKKRQMLDIGYLDGYTAAYNLWLGEQLKQLPAGIELPKPSSTHRAYRSEWHSGFEEAVKDFPSDIWARLKTKYEAKHDLAKNIFQGKSRPWLEGFQAFREYRIACKLIENGINPGPIARPENPYIGDPRTQLEGKSWSNGWCECKEYPFDRIPDPTDELSKPSASS